MTTGPAQWSASSAADSSSVAGAATMSSASAHCGSAPSSTSTRRRRAAGPRCSPGARRAPAGSSGADVARLHSGGRGGASLRVGPPCPCCRCVLRALVRRELSPVRRACHMTQQPCGTCPKQSSGSLHRQYCFHVHTCYAFLSAPNSPGLPVGALPKFVIGLPSFCLAPTAFASVVSNMLLGASVSFAVSSRWVSLTYWPSLK